MKVNIYRAPITLPDKTVFITLLVYSTFILAKIGKIYALRSFVLESHLLIRGISGQFLGILSDKFAILCVCVLVSWKET